MTHLLAVFTGAFGIGFLANLPPAARTTGHVAAGVALCAAAVIVLLLDHMWHTQSF